jgi:hypothetical protein
VGRNVGAALDEGDADGRPDVTAGVGPPDVGDDVAGGIVHGYSSVQHGRSYGQSAYPPGHGNDSFTGRWQKRWASSMLMPQY